MLPTDLVSPNKGESTAAPRKYAAIRMHIKWGLTKRCLARHAQLIVMFEGIDWKWTVKTHNGEEQLTKKFMPRPMGKDG